MVIAYPCKVARRCVVYALQESYSKIGGSLMFTPQQYRAKAAEYTVLVKTASNPADVLEFQTLERSFTVLADNAQWLADNQSKIIRAAEPDPST